MPVEAPTMFSQVIQDHLALKQRNQSLEPQMPLDRYKHEDPFDNHPLFKTEEQARIEETMDGVESPIAAAEPVLAWPGEATVENAREPEELGLWGRSRDFDWGD